MSIRVVSIVMAALGLGLLAGCGSSDNHPPSVAAASEPEDSPEGRNETTDGGAVQLPARPAEGEQDGGALDSDVQGSEPGTTDSNTGDSNPAGPNSGDAAEPEPEYVPPTADFAKGIDASAGEAIRGGLDEAPVVDGGVAIDGGVLVDGGARDAAAAAN